MNAVDRRAGVLLAAVFAGCVATPAADGDAVPMLCAHGLAFVEVGGADAAPLLALLDTGASASAIDPARAAALPAIDVVDVVGTTGALRAERVRIEGLALGRTLLPVLHATRRDLGGLLAPPGRRVELILGADAFAGRVLALDFAARTVALRAAPTPGFAAVPMALDNGIPTLPAELGGESLQLRVDTGASLFATDDVYVNLPLRTWSRIAARLGAPAACAQLSGTGADGRSVDLPVFRLAAARIAMRTLPAAFAIVQPEQGYFAVPDALGFVSNNFLAPLQRVEFDYGGGRFLTAP